MRKTALTWTTAAVTLVILLAAFLLAGIRGASVRPPEHDNRYEHSSHEHER